MSLKKTNDLYRGKVRIGVTQDGKPIDKFVSGQTVKDLAVAKEAARDHFIYRFAQSHVIGHTAQGRTKYGYVYRRQYHTARSRLIEKKAAYLRSAAEIAGTPMHLTP